KGRRTLFDVLATEPAEWRPYLALVLTRYGLWMSYWQMGPDRAGAIEDRPLMAAAGRHMSEEMRPLIGAARIVVPQSSDWVDAESVIGEVASLRPPEGSPPSQLARQLQSKVIKPGRESWAPLRPLDGERYQ